MNDLQTSRQNSQVFAGKQGFITLRFFSFLHFSFAFPNQFLIFFPLLSLITINRDLFRWANRHPSSYEELGQCGFMLLGERLRVGEERELVQNVIEKHLKVKLDMQGVYEKYFEDHRKEIEENKDFAGIVWTNSMKRLFSLTSLCLDFLEPVLLVGETGCGIIFFPCPLFFFFFSISNQEDFIFCFNPIPQEKQLSARLCLPSAKSLSTP